MDSVPFWVLGGIGAVLVHVLNFIEAAKLPKDERPSYWDLHYWIAVILTAVLGAIAAGLYFEPGLKVTPWLAVHIGASSPLVFRTMASTFVSPPNVEQGA